MILLEYVLSATGNMTKKITKKPKLKFQINNKLKGYGSYDTNTGVAEINVRRHKNDKKQLADSVRHEKFHHDHPKATEKTTYKKTGKLANMSMVEQNKLIAKLRMKKLNMKSGAIKRKLHWKGSAKPGDLISKMNESKINRTKSTNPSKEKISIMGLV